MYIAYCNSNSTVIQISDTMHDDVDELKSKYSIVVTARRWDGAMNKAFKQLNAIPFNPASDVAAPHNDVETLPFPL